MPFPRVLFTLLLSALATTLAVDAAEARKRFRMPVVVPIPKLQHTAAPEIVRDVVKVLDLPNTPAFQRDDGSYVDLGYHFIGENGGEWVGYIGSSKDYLSISPDQMSGILQRAGLTQLPPVPSRAAGNGSGSGGSGSMMMWLAGLAAAGFLFRLARRTKGAAAGTGPRVPADVARSDDETPGAWVTRAEAGAAAAAGPPHSVGLRAPRAAASRSATIVRSGRGSFGLRA